MGCVGSTAGAGGGGGARLVLVRARRPLTNETPALFPLPRGREWLTGVDTKKDVHLFGLMMGKA